MKRLFVSILSYFWGIGVLLPLIFRLITGRYVRDYSGAYYVPDRYMTETTIIITVVIFASILVIVMMPGGKRLRPTYKVGSWYYYLVLFSLIFGRMFTVGISKNAGFVVLNGGLNATLFAYLSMFLEPFTLLLIYLLGTEREINIWGMELLYISYLFICGSRAAALWALVSLMCFFVSSSKYKEYKKQLILMGIACVVVSPLIFVISTQNRNGSAGSNYVEIIDSIVNRCSKLEHGAIPLWEWNMGTYDKELFYQKYGILNQFGFVFDSLIPGSVFVSDTSPNQYYRSCFLGLPEHLAQTRYNSDNMTLPIYFTVKYGYMAGIVFSIILIVFVYIICLRFKDYAISRVMATVVLLELLDYFDWYMVVKRLVDGSLTIMMFWFARKFIKTNVRLVTALKFRKYKCQRRSRIRDEEVWSDVSNIALR